MWLISKYGFVSVVAHLDKPGWVLVRTRDRSDLEEFRSVARDCDVPGFSEEAIEENSSADYRFRMTVKDEDWAELAKALALGIDYPNFKNVVASVDPERAAVYGAVWADLMKIQYPGSEAWPDANGQDRKDTVVHLYREAAAHLEWCLREYEDSLPAAEESEMLGSAMDPPFIVERSEPDAVDILEERLVQRIAIGFWWQADGRGFERLRNAIDQARSAAALQLTDSDWADVD
jgi:hypothetical protein